MRFRAVVVIGNRAGKIGLGVAKGRDVAKSVEKATRLAKKYLITVPITEDTIPHEVYSKFGAARVLLRPQRKGRGLVAGGTVRVVCALAGIKNYEGVTGKFSFDANRNADMTPYVLQIKDGKYTELK